MKKLAVISYSALIFVSCQNGLGKKHSKQELFISSPTTIIEDISEYNRVDGSAVGIAGIKSEQYKRYEVLKTFSEDSLIKLTNHQNPVVRAYAFEAIVKKGSDKSRLIFEDHISDTTEFKSMSGCIVSHEAVNIYYYRCIKDKLNKKEKEMYKVKVFSYYPPGDYKLIFAND